MYKNVASQKVAVYAHDTSADAAKAGDAANVTAYISKDGAAAVQSNDVNPTELDATNLPGVYIFDLTQAETSCDLFVLVAKSATSNIQLDPVIAYTLPGDNTALNPTAAVVATAVWASGTRTLTQSAASVTSTVSGTALTITRGDTLSASLTGLGSLTGYVTIDFTIKGNEGLADTAALVRIRLNASGLNHGLLRLNGADASARAANGSIAINDSAAGDITVTLAAAETDDLTVQPDLRYDVQLITASAVTTLTAGRCDVVGDVTRAIT